VASAIDRLRPSSQSVSPRRWRLVGVVAATVLTAASWFCGAVLHEYQTVWPGVIPWRAGGGSPLAATLVLVATGGMLYAWWALRDALVTVRWHVHTATLWFAPLLLSAPLYSRDIYSYAAQGLMLHEGLDPYREGVNRLDSPWVESVSRVWLDTPAPYGPLFLVLARLAAALSGGHLLVALVLLRLLAVAGLLVLCWAVPAIADRVGVDPVRAAWLAILAPLVGGHLVSGAHNDSLMVAGMAAALALALRRHYVWALFAVAAAVAVKGPAVVIIPFVAILWAADHDGPRAMTWLRLIGRSVLGGVAAVAAFAVLSLGTGLGFSWLAALGTPGRTVEWTSLPTGLGVGLGAIGGLFGHDVTDAAVATCRGVALVVLAVTLVGVWLHAVRHSHDRRVVVRCSGQAVLAVVVLSPAFHGWYLLWALPVLAATMTSRRWLTALALVASLLSVAVLPGGYGLALTTTWVGVPLTFLLTGMLVVALARWSRAYPWAELFSLAGADPKPADARGRARGAVEPDGR